MYNITASQHYAASVMAVCPMEIPLLILARTKTNIHIMEWFLCSFGTYCINSASVRTALSVRICEEIAIGKCLLREVPVYVVFRHL